MVKEQLPPNAVIETKTARIVFWLPTAENYPRLDITLKGSDETIELDLTEEQVNKFTQKLVEHMEKRIMTKKK